ncbi:protein kinase domain-containing protein [Rhodocyclus tenuis]|uniref:Serine/threonine protein kinase n=1 Tax=Rhodocyclus tenuis TaxID=1066 RepID=A0A840FVN1_RHOTE|nr:serine/threonine-protein kinase [Rhodocyclus tenuis]MBB4245784.1 serine/threonine protein kinase [Rhodocyclus tenuis]
MDRIGKYEIVRELGRGASATVYLGRDPFAGRDVAIKLASPEALRNPQQGRRYAQLFLTEASLVGKLAHPHIAQIYDAVVAERVTYIVMEYVAGGTLERFCGGGRLLPVARIVDIIFKCTRALDFASRLGITHRDIKPANILLVDASPECTDIRISDFGAAIVGHPQRTQVAGIGSPAFMSPEQVREQPLDQRTDIYSLGVVMYQLLAGQLPFPAGSHYHVVHQILNAKPPPPSALRAEVPARLDAIVARAMARELAERYPDWESFADDLALLAGDGTQPLPAREFAESAQFNTLRALDFFADFPDVELWEVLRFSHWHTVLPGEKIMRDGETGDSFCFLAAGELKVIKNGRLLNLLTAGDCFGEMALIGRQPARRGADVIALTDARILTVRGDALQQASDACRMHFYQSFMGVLGERLRLANDRLCAL